MSDEQNSEQFENTDRELWRARDGDYYSDKIFVTKDGWIGMDVGGTGIVLPIRRWHQLAVNALREELSRGKP